MRRAESRQKERIEAAWCGSSRSFSANGDHDAHAANLGKTESASKGGLRPLYGDDDSAPVAYERDGIKVCVAYNSDGESELPGLFEPAMRNKLQSEQGDTEATVERYIRRKHERRCLKCRKPCAGKSPWCATHAAERNREQAKYRKRKERKIRNVTENRAKTPHSEG
jgi:hypothetical protein